MFSSSTDRSCSLDWSTRKTESRVRKNGSPPPRSTCRSSALPRNAASRAAGTQTWPWTSSRRTRPQPRLPRPWLGVTAFRNYGDVWVEGIPLLAEEGWRDSLIEAGAPGAKREPDRAKPQLVVSSARRVAGLLLRLRPIGLALRATPSAPSLRSAQPPLLCEEGNAKLFSLWNT